MFDFENDHRRHAYRMGRAGFGILSLALLVGGLRLLYVLWMFFTFPMRGGLHHSWFDFGISTFISMTCLIGYYLLWNTSTERSWRKRAGALVVMGMINVVLWGIEYRQQLGLLIGYHDILPEKHHPWLREQIAMGLGWFRMMWTGGLAWSMLAHFHSVSKDPEAKPRQTDRFLESWQEPTNGFEIPYLTSMVGNGTVVLARAGLVEWLILCAIFADLRHWPIEWDIPRNMASLFFLIYFGLRVMYTIGLFKVAFLGFSASRISGQVIRSMKTEDGMHELLRSRSEEDF